MQAQLIDGKTISANARAALLPRIAALKAKGVTPSLTVILVGEDPASQVYVRNKEKGAAELGMDGRVIRLDADTPQEELIALIRKLNEDPSVHGVLVQLPLPKHMDELKVLETVAYTKDVDGFHVMNAGSLLSGRPGFVACTPKGIIRLIESTGVPIEGKEAVVVGRSNIVGKPAAILLLERHATVTVCHSRTKNLGEVTRRADILIAAIGRPEFIKGNMVKPGAIVIDVGTTRVDDKLKGDVAFDEAAAVAGYITPVPGGVGPMTIAMLLENTVEAAEKYAGI